MLRKNSAEEREQVLRELLKKKGNNRCANCYAIGPQYVIMKYRVFVCTACSGVHRTFGHRVKGIYMSSFTDAEIDDLSNGGNDVFFSTFCASWRPDLMARPGSNDMERCHQWIDAVYEKRNFFSDTRANLESASSASKDSIAESPALKVGNENVAVLNMSDVVAGASVIVSAGRKTSSTGNVESEEDKIKRTTKAKEEWKLELGERQKEGGSIAIKASTLLNQSASEKPASPQLVQLQGALLDKWDPFGILNEQQSIDQSRSKSSNEGGWAVFDISMAEPQKESPSTLKTSSLLATHTLETVSEVKETQKEEIKNTSKGDLPMENDKANVADLDLKAVSLSDSTFSQTAGLLPAEHEALNRSITENPVRDTGKVDTSNSDVRKDHRKEVPLDLFFPEFEQIRATGILPTGQFVGPVMRSQVGNLPAEHVGNIQNVYVSSPAAPFPNGRALNYGRASFAPSPVQSTLGSPGYEGMLSQEYRNYDFPMQYTNGSPSQGSSSNQNPRESAMPPYYANYSPHVSSPGNYQPQANFSDGKGFMHSQLKETGSEIKGSPADTASMTLYGQNLGMTAYDLSAPAAPRAHSTGNPFA